jgi:hypothetical protein
MIATSQMFTACVQPHPADARAAHRRMTGPAARQVLTPDQLLTAINHLLTARPECEGLKVEGTLAPSSRGEPDGCNWQPHGLCLRVEHGPSTRALAGVRQVVELARLRWDLATAI